MSGADQSQEARQRRVDQARLAVLKVMLRGLLLRVSEAQELADQANCGPEFLEKLEAVEDAVCVARLALS